MDALAEELSDEEIADNLCVSGESVRTHRVNIRAKLQVKLRSQALVFAVCRRPLHPTPLEPRETTYWRDGTICISGSHLKRN